MHKEKDMDTFFTLLIVMLCGLWVGRKFLNTLHSKGGSSCGCDCTGCDSEIQKPSSCAPNQSHSPIKDK